MPEEPQLPEQPWTLPGNGDVLGMVRDSMEMDLHWLNGDLSGFLKRIRDRELALLRETVKELDQ